MLHTPPGIVLPTTSHQPTPQPTPRPAPQPATTPCTIPGNAYSASWISGVTTIPGTDTLLITHNDVCVQGTTISNQAFGLVQYRPATNALGPQARVFTTPTGLPFQHALGSPIITGGHLYLYGSTCDTQAFGTCTNGRVTLARVPARPHAWTNPAAYRWHTPRGWTPDPAQATTVLPGGAPLAVHAADYTTTGDGYALIEQRTLGGDFQIWRAPHPTGPWEPLRRGRMPCGGQSGLDLCRAYIGHPELSTRRDLLVSYYNPADGHISVRAVPW
ncbi:hypothetical protein [Actinomadura sp. SCN-SB]|uniref:hypothetical protein n=1 Tax=Actinomadura sp. SCN-SB TaxID=3373092 RepID=UPI0037524575